VITDPSYVPVVQPAGPLTAEELLRTHLPHKQVELVRGILVVRGLPGYRHGDVAARITKVLIDVVDARGLGWVAVASGFKLGSNPDTVRAADVAFVAKARLPDPEYPGYPALAHYEAIAALVEAAERLGHLSHVGVTATAPGFYGAQGRPIPQLPIRYPDLAEEMARQRVLNFEMEASALLVLAGLAGCRAGVICAVYAQRTTGDFVTGEAKDRADAACVETGLEGLLILAEMSRQKQAAATDRWRPSLWGRS
jgi:hypothetical protein